MNALLRATAMLVDPAAAWTRLDREPLDPVYLLTGYVAVLALIPALSSLIGACFIGVMVPGGNIARAPIVDGMFSAIFGYVVTLAKVPLVALLIEALAPLFGGRRDFASALKLAAYSFTPVWLAGIFLLLPGLHFLALAGFYGAYILAKGLPLLMKSPAPKSQAYAAAIVGFATLLTYLTVAAQRALFGHAGISV